MYGYKKVIEALQAKVAALTDPEETTGTHIFSKVTIGQPEKISFYNGPGAVLLFGDVSKIECRGTGGQLKQATIDGAIITFIPGNTAKSVLKCYHYSDIIGDLLENRKALELRGCTITNSTTTPHNWRTVDVNKATNPKQPKKCIAGATLFTITKSKEKN